MKLSTLVLLVGFVLIVLASLGGHDCPPGSVLVRDAISATKTYCVRTVQP